MMQRLPNQGPWWMLVLTVFLTQTIRISPRILINPTPPPVRSHQPSVNTVTKKQTNLLYFLMSKDKVTKTERMRKVCLLVMRGMIYWTIWA